MSLKALILDMDGVLWHGSQPLGNLPQIFRRIRALHLEALLATNNATRTPEEYVQKLASFGVTLDPQKILTAALATAQALREDFPQGGSVYVVGENGLIQAIRQAGFEIPPADDLPQQVTAVAAGLDTRISYQKLTHATLLIRRGAPFYGSNPDLTYPIPQGQAPGAGAILAALQAGSGVAPKIIGKPQPYLFQQALQRLGLPPESVLMVGDRLETDIAGAQNVGLRTALVLSGVTSSAQAADWHPAPDWIAADLSALLDRLERQQ